MKALEVEVSSLKDAHWPNSLMGTTAEKRAPRAQAEDRPKPLSAHHKRSLCPRPRCSCAVPMPSSGPSLNAAGIRLALIKLGELKPEERRKCRKHLCGGEGLQSSQILHGGEQEAIFA